MPIIVNLDVMLARRKMRSKELAERIGITEQNVSLLKSGKVKGVRFDTLERLCRYAARPPLAAERLSRLPDRSKGRVCPFCPSSPSPHRGASDRLSGNPVQL